MALSLSRVLGSHRPAPPPLQPGDYATDGLRLLRVTAVLLADGNPVFVYLEDCLTLAVAAYCADEIELMRLRRVVV